MGQIQMGAGDDESGWQGAWRFPVLVERRCAPTGTLRAANEGGLIRPDFRAYFVGTAYRGF
jgi:hypothetical protein